MSVATRFIAITSQCRFPCLNNSPMVDMHLHMQHPGIKPPIICLLCISSASHHIILLSHLGYHHSSQLGVVGLSGTTLLKLGTIHYISYISDTISHLSSLLSSYSKCQVHTSTPCTTPPGAATKSVRHHVLTLHLSRIFSMPLLGKLLNSDDNTVLTLVIAASTRMAHSE